MIVVIPACHDRVQSELRAQRISYAASCVSDNFEPWWARRLAAGLHDGERGMIGLGQRPYLNAGKRRD